MRSKPGSRTVRPVAEPRPTPRAPEAVQLAPGWLAAESLPAASRATRELRQRSRADLRCRQAWAPARPRAPIATHLHSVRGTEAAAHRGSPAKERGACSIARSQVAQLRIVRGTHRPACDTATI